MYICVWSPELTLQAKHQPPAVGNWPGNLYSLTIVGSWRVWSEAVFMVFGVPTPVAVGIVNGVVVSFPNPLLE
ncbi:hypothetical protein I7I48_06288 [Histoplasma ohiense]|nr:hypothetical protein I7I48_06288 [Histoplasma ohiense (nom. inval.)]